MSTERILIHGTTAQRMATTPALGQIGSDDETGRVVVGDGSTPGGIEMARLDEIGGGTAEEISYDNTTSGLAAETVQDAADEIVEMLGGKADRATVVLVDEVQAFTAVQKGQAIANLGGGVLVGYRDKIINGDGQISQGTYTTVADDTYWCDQHYVLTQTAAITPTVISDVADGLPSMMRLTQSQAAAQRMGNSQILEATVAKRLRGKKVTLGGKLRCSSAQAIRFAVLEWTGAADTVTSDVVASWTSATFTAGNFFLGSNITVAAIDAITPAANAVADWSLVADISSACNNLIVLYWTESTAAQNVTLDMAWGLVEGDASAEKWPYAARHLGEELDLCLRYFEVGDTAWGNIPFWPFAAPSHGTASYFVYSFKVMKRVVPTVSNVTYNNLSSPNLVAGIAGIRFGGTATAAASITGGFIIDARL